MIFKEAKPPTPNHPTPQTHSKKTHTHGHTNTNISATKNIIGKATIYYERLQCFLLKQAFNSISQKQATNITWLTDMMHVFEVGDLSLYVICHYAEHYLFSM